MQNSCILCDFDGTITEKDGLYSFFSQYASKNWIEVERLWEEGKINSKECLKREFEFIADLNEELIVNYLYTIKIDKYFKDFYFFVNNKNIDFYIVSDGIDYFIEKILKINKINNIKIISNHFEFINGDFKITFPNDSKTCINNSGTCKCTVLYEMKKKYKSIIYIGDGISDYCVCKKADKLYAKNVLSDYCSKNNIKHTKFKNFKDIIQDFKTISI